MQALSRRRRRRVARAQRTHAERGAAVRVRWPSQARRRAAQLAVQHSSEGRADLAKGCTFREIALRRWFWRHKWQCKVGNNNSISLSKWFTFPVCEITFFTQQHEHTESPETLAKVTALSIDHLQRKGRKTEASCLYMSIDHLSSHITSK